MDFLEAHVGGVFDAVIGGLIIIELSWAWTLYVLTWLTTLSRASARKRAGRLGLELQVVDKLGNDLTFYVGFLVWRLAFFITTITILLANWSLAVALPSASPIRGAISVVGIALAAYSGYATSRLWDCCHLEQRIQGQISKLNQRAHSEFK
jgi:hypothetical protein